MTERDGDIERGGRRERERERESKICSDFVARQRSAVYHLAEPLAASECRVYLDDAVPKARL